MEENAEKVANAGIEEAGDAEEVPFEEVETPELEKVPHRTRKKRDEEVMNQSVEESAAEEETPKRRRRRKAQEE